MSRPAARLAVTTACGAIFAFAAYSLAQPSAVPSAPSNGRIAVIDFHRIFDETRQIGDLNQQIKTKESEFRAEADQRKKVIETKQKELVAFTPGTPDYESRRKDLVRLNIESNVWLQTTQAEIDSMKFDWTQLIYEKAVDVARQVAAERGYDAVLQYKEYDPMMVDPNVQAMRRLIQDREVIYHRPEIDITNDVIKRMDQQYRPQAPAAPVNATPMKTP